MLFGWDATDLKFVHFVHLRRENEVPALNPQVLRNAEVRGIFRIWGKVSARSKVRVATSEYDFRTYNISQYRCVVTFNMVDGAGHT